MHHILDDKQQIYVDLEKNNKWLAEVRNKVQNEKDPQDEFVENLYKIHIFVGQILKHKMNRIKKKFEPIENCHNNVVSSTGKVITISDPSDVIKYIYQL